MILNTKYKILNTNKGQLLVESMIGIGVALIGLLGILGLISNSASVNRVVSQQLVGNYLASEGIEIVKNLLDADWIQDGVWNDTFITSSGSFEVDYTSPNLLANGNRQLLFNPATNLYSYSSGNPTPFIRTINIQFIGPDEVKINSIVTWNTRGGANYSVNLEDHFFNWKIMP